MADSDLPKPNPKGSEQIQQATTEIRTFQEPEFLFAEKAPVEIYLREGGKNSGDVFHTFSLREGILHLLSTEGKRLTVKEFPTGEHGVGEPEFSIRVYKFGSELGTQLVAPMLSPFVKADEVKWDSNYQLIGLDTRPLGEVTEIQIGNPEDIDAEAVSKYSITLDIPGVDKDERPVTTIRRFDTNRSMFDYEAPETEIQVEITDRNNETFNTPTLSEGILHLISTSGKLLNIREVSPSNGSIYSITVEREGNVLKSKIRAPMLIDNNLIDKGIDWNKSDGLNVEADDLAGELFKKKRQDKPISGIDFKQITLTPF